MTKGKKRCREKLRAAIFVAARSSLPIELSLSSCLATGQTGLMRARYGCLARLGCNKLDFLRL